MQPQLVRAQQQLREIHHARALALRFVLRVELDQLPARRVVAVLQRRRAMAFILVVIDELLDLARHPARFVELHGLHDLLDEPQLIFAVEDLEALRQAPRRASAGAAAGARCRGTCPPTCCFPECLTTSRCAPRISCAALFVNVTARMECGDAPCVWMTQAMRCVSTRVLPEPAPASTSTGPTGAVTAARCASFSESRIGERSFMGARIIRVCARRNSKAR